MLRIIILMTRKDEPGRERSWNLSPKLASAMNACESKSRTFYAIGRGWQSLNLRGNMEGMSVKNVSEEWQDWNRNDGRACKRLLSEVLYNHEMTLKVYKYYYNIHS